MEDNYKIYVVEDDEWYRELLVYHLSMNPDFEVESFETAKACLNAMHKRPAVMTLDYSLPDMDGLKLLKNIKENYPETEVIVVSEQKDIETAVELLREGAYDYLVKDPDVQSRIHNLINHIRHSQELRTEVRKLRAEVSEKYTFDKTIIGRSKPMVKVFKLLEKAASSNITVYLTGETGTGKEIAAKAIHYNSARKEGPFVPVNMAAIPSELVESELFGHEKGAFTGAATRRKGKFEEANAGTIFLDEIAELDLNQQAKLLRVLQEKEVIRVGSNKIIPLDCRIIIATHRNLREEVKEGRFREDLYYRLMGLQVELPPLRERGEDIMLIGKKFLKDYCKENGWTDKHFSPDAARRIMSYPWPGNIRELRSAVELAGTLADGETIETGDLQLQALDSISSLLLETSTLKEYNRKIILSFLDRHDNNIMKVAEILDIGKSTIYRLLKEEEEQEMKH